MKGSKRPMSTARGLQPSYIPRVDEGNRVQVPYTKPVENSWNDISISLILVCSPLLHMCRVIPHCIQRGGGEGGGSSTTTKQ